MARCAASLRVRESEIAAGRVLVAESEDAGVLGVAAVVPEGPTADLDLLFVEPARLGQGAGRALFAASAALATRLGAARLTILADPHAAAFYERQGARFLRNAPSDAIPGRLLPLYEYALVQEARR
ncbi:MAG: GNAT family N-acetyltransferase [Alphaproteobacteria bacterium]|nr:GNAT family N-acetyltransferase [Alphaproteobacteria bacterium]